MLLSCCVGVQHEKLDCGLGRFWRAAVCGSVCGAESQVLSLPVHVCSPPVDWGVACKAGGGPLNFLLAVTDG